MNLFLTIATDPKGNRVKTYTDPRKLQTTLIVDSTITTTFEYNAMGELLQSTDPESHSTYYTYNNFGQKVSRNHPDAGIDQFTFDLAGNLLNRQTQDLINNSMTINYEYNYNQMTAIHYPKNPENDVNYYYGDINAQNNCIGRVYAIEDASGRQEFSYGAMGEVIGNIRTFALPNESNTYTFRMKFEYDSWNRILKTTYPDGEDIRYWYNTGGQLSKMESDYNNVTYNYIDSIYYNEFEKRTKICYGNGTKAEYKYDILQRLIQLKSTSASGVMQRIEYTFDDVNNITSIDNSAGVLSNGLGGVYSHSYSYDNIYRLTTSSGNWDNNNDYLDYSLEMSYTDDGRISSKTQSGSTLLNGTISIFSYQNDYNYNTSQSHTLGSVYDNSTMTYQDFEWDANGNMIRHHTQFPQDNMRQMCWDEENRLMAVGDNNYTSYYVYDNGGERTYKLTGPNSLMNINGNWMNFVYMDNSTLYTSAYLVASVQGYSKHYYAGSERIASAIGLGGLKKVSIPLELHTYEHNWEYKSAALHDEMDRTITECLGNEYTGKKNLEILYHLEDEPSSGTMDRYFYHPDHLGSSSWITDGSGNAIQHLHYLPFGEDWVDQRNSSWNTPYTFSGKEKDVETGYGYFGARYYDSGLSIWLSVDPMSDKYPSMSPYNYCANNPVMLVDPDGRDFINGGENGIDPSLVSDNVSQPNSTSYYGNGSFIHTEENDNSNNNSQNRIRPITMTVGSVPFGQAITWSYPYNNKKTYIIPTYQLTVTGTDASGNQITKVFEVIRFGVNATSDGKVKIVGLADYQTYKIKAWDPTYPVHSYPSTEDGAWQVFGDYLIHDGPDLPITQSYATAGCIEICGGPNGFITFNKFLLTLSGANSYSELGSSRMMTIIYNEAVRPPLKLFKP